MKPKSETLFHFTKSSDTLEIILKNGFWPRYCLEDIRWLEFTDVEYVSYPMVCFCDIPLSRISEHVSFYGSFGLGVSKDWAKKKIN
ncbi:abortive infection system antitoxin AbiGi family protein [Kluyvera sichuanensis]|uniref:abortive infection system antitoxin AbiGi family protein n=1 Tax=Kluyvera sichuanensis TaxID=2725494 RepID=UPI0039F4FF9E